MEAGFLSGLQQHAFLQNALWASLLSSVACGTIGSFVVVRRISYIAGGIAHCVLGGMGAAQYLRAVCGLSWLHPLHGAVAASLLAAVVIGLVSLYAREREDTVIGAVWAIGMAVGVLFISSTPGYDEDLMSYLFGNILFVSGEDLWLLAVLDAVILLGGGLFFNQFMGICFDEEFARLRGVRVDLFYLGLLCLTALTVVLLTTVVGVVMVIALLTLPAATAGHFTRSLTRMMLLAVAFSAIYGVGGLALSYGPGLPAGATIIVLAGAGYLLAAVGRGLLGRLGRR
ncbi:MAG: metal ABC transporter permease [Deltaproteobacteria bacterium]|nr:metal ABC transporter permease [Deltaproteobacteria bacterium]